MIDFCKSFKGCGFDYIFSESYFFDRCLLATIKLFYNNTGDRMAEIADERCSACFGDDIQYTKNATIRTFDTFKSAWKYLADLNLISEDTMEKIPSSQVVLCRIHLETRPHNPFPPKGNTRPWMLRLLDALKLCG